MLNRCTPRRSAAAPYSRGRAPRASRFFSCFYRALLTHYTLSGERVHHTHKHYSPTRNTRLARPACYTMATFSGFCLRAFAASRLESAVKQVGGSGGDRDGGGGGRGLGGRRCRDVCPCLCVGGVARRGSGRAAGRNRTATAAAGTGAVAVTQGWWRPPRAGCSRRGEVAGGRDRCALLECARQSSSGCSHGDLRARGRQGSRRSPCSPGAQSRWGVGGRERAARPAYR